MIFLFDREDSHSFIKDLKNWEEAENYAEEHSYTLLGEFTHWVDPDTGNVIYLH